MIRYSLLLLLSLGLIACERQEAATPSIVAPSASPQVSLSDAREGFRTRLTRKVQIGEPVPTPPADLFRVVYYASPVGPLASYISPSPADGQKHPLIIWLTGGFSNSISEIAWTPGPEDNDQSGSEFRKAGVLMMYPALRGGNDNPGFLEGFYGEVDDVIAAAEYASKLDYVDPERIYLGGHSTGGTLALLVAASTNRFRAVFSFGPVEEVTGYGSEYLPFDMSTPKEAELRSPFHWLPSIRSRTFVIEGADGRSNIESLRTMAKTKNSGSVSFHAVSGADHFSTLAPISRLIAAKIKADMGAGTTIIFPDQELAAAMRK